MTQRHAMRRGVTPRPSDKDLRLLRRLAARAVVVAGNPMTNAEPMVIAAEKAGKAILPVGHQTMDSPFVRLARLAAGYLKLGPVEREARSVELGELARACGEVLDGLAEGPRRRKDIDG